MSEEQSPWDWLKGQWQGELEDAKKLEGGGPNYKVNKKDVVRDLKAHGPNSPADPDRNIADLFKDKED